MNPADTGSDDYEVELGGGMSSLGEAGEPVLQASGGLASQRHVAGSAGVALRGLRKRG